jgi:plastocyanin
MFKKLVAMLAIAMLAMFVLAACGDDDDDAEDTGSTESTTATTAVTSDGGSAEVIAVKMTEMAFDPESITVGAGEEVTVELSNDGAVEHNMSIDDADASHTLSAGDAETVTFTAPSEPGEYKIYCDIPGHEAAGMVATLIVE